MNEISQKQLEDVISKYKSDHEILHDLMPFRVREILVVATIYDAFILEQEGQLSEQIFGEYFKLNLSTAPRITSVSNSEEAVDKIKSSHFDMVIIMIRIGGTPAYSLCKKIKSIYPDIPTLLLLNDNSDIRLLEGQKTKLRCFDNIFVWNGDSNIFLAMIKYIEDKKNVDQDTHKGLVRVILLVEDSPLHRSILLPMLYSELVEGRYSGKASTAWDRR